MHPKHHPQPRLLLHLPQSSDQLRHAEAAHLRGILPPLSLCSSAAAARRFRLLALAQIGGNNVPSARRSARFIRRAVRAEDRLRILDEGQNTLRVGDGLRDD
ncbi:hypothetical protein DACRYDRAFT_21525 [Dacryopinax primogenitus]|uniref:Uncharacterized protein n=1 Tax=Dacryopinax primogenitus (strain DJM 731) TaxID=1858805 RepID=M5G515_DACPD|nr:uncharacterized protein DACRYDRAFT_21525 [Dacryopinax primogenitus]EJU03315.1 hypothetical protein DACRYDRAFT_21525 [Dacryopinax primogenitus]